MENYQGTIYFADIQVDGSTYVVQVDTGSSDLWLSCYYLKDVTCKATCPKDTSIIAYGSGNVCVQGTSATIEFGDVTVSNYVVGIAQGSNVQPRNSESLLVGDAQGLFGLAYTSLATLPSPGGQFINYVTSFSMYLTKDDQAKGSFLVLNGVDAAHISSHGLTPYTITLKTANPSHWTIGMTAMQFGDTDATFPCPTSSKGSCDTIVDSGTSLLSMPKSVYEAFVKTYLSGCTLNSAVYMCPVDVELPRLAFTFENVTFYLEKDDYITALGLDTVLVQLQATSTSDTYANTWIMGETFLKVFYTGYNVNESVTFYCVENSTCTPGSKAVAVAPSSDSSGDSTAGNNFGDNSNGGIPGITSSGNDNTTTILAILLGAVAVVVVISAVIYLLRCICRRHKRAAPQSLEPVLVVPGDYYMQQPDMQRADGYRAHY
ncbi:hypothetical protein PsorP6_007254 [Peronosclerospora sorghi]|uniref:Uncharacterized protein n=1 Tax=Peronosclerospora sorghi TaxID=230839 RepID=A0ACC0W7P5_9STRA|nr:hypothetical protein PsorP6_007254 [Peronosclerospora sorghi]